MWKVYKSLQYNLVLFKRETFSGALVWLYKQVLLLMLIFNQLETKIYYIFIDSLFR